MFLVDYLHQQGTGVVLDWVPSHFPADGHGPGFFDGTHLYEHADPRRGFHPDWRSFIFSYGRNELRSFLLSSALPVGDTHRICRLGVPAHPSGELAPGERWRAGLPDRVYRALYLSYPLQSQFLHIQGSLSFCRT